MDAGSIRSGHVSEARREFRDSPKIRVGPLRFRWMYRIRLDRSDERKT